MISDVATKFDIQDYSIKADNKSFEKILAEETNIQKIVDLLESLNIKVKTDYGNYRSTYDILKDISKKIYD